jgi:hypothetical protein
MNDYSIVLFEIGHVKFIGRVNIITASSDLMAGYDIIQNLLRKIV